MASSARRCPCCGADEARPLFTKAGWDLVECPRCKTAFTAKLPTTEELKAHYALDYFKGNRDKFGYVDYAAEEPFNLETFRPKAAWLERRHPSGGRVLDVGCATGGFLSLMSEKWDRRGVELSEELLEESPPPPGVKVWIGRFEDYPASEGPFDAVTLWDSLDHVPDPKGMIEKARSLLKPGGTLAVSQGDRGSLFARAMGKRWHIYIPPTHLTYFTREGLIGLLERSGCEIEHARYEGKWVPLSLAFFRLSYILDWGIVRRLYEWSKTSSLGNLKLYVNQRDVITVYARAV